MRCDACACSARTASLGSDSRAVFLRKCTSSWSERSARLFGIMAVRALAAPRTAAVYAAIRRYNASETNEWRRQFSTKEGLSLIVVRHSRNLAACVFAERIVCRFIKLRIFSGFRACNFHRERRLPRSRRGLSLLKERELIRTSLWKATTCIRLASDSEWPRAVLFEDFVFHDERRLKSTFEARLKMSLRSLTIRRIDGLSMLDTLLRACPSYIFQRSMKSN